MYAGHFAAGLAIKAAQPRMPTAPLMALIFLPDFLWLAFSIVGLETVDPAPWFDGWSHSIVSILFQAGLAAALWVRWDRGLAIAAGSAILSHLLLDLPMHPAPLEWYAHSSGGLGDFLHGWAREISLFSKTRGWWVETAVVALGLSIYLAASRRVGVSKSAAAASAILVGSLQVAFG